MNANYFLISILISFIDGPQFTHNSTEYERCLGESALIMCSAVGRPMPDVSLHFNGNVLQRNLTNLTYQLQLDSANKFATYTCVGNSTVGTANITITFKKKSKCIHEKSALSI